MRHCQDVRNGGNDEIPTAIAKAGDVGSIADLVRSSDTTPAASPAAESDTYFKWIEPLTIFPQLS